MLPENLGLKLRYILWPYLRALAMLAVAWAGVNALLFEYLPLFEPPYWLWTVVVPIGLAMLVVWRLWPSLALVRAVKLGRSDLREVVIAVVFGILAITAGFAPGIVKATVSQPLRLASLTQLPSARAARYYQVPQLQADVRQAGWEETWENRKGTIYYRLFAVCPVWADTTHKVAPVAWVGFRYATSHRQTDAGSAEAEAFSQFRQACKLKLLAEHTHPFDHLERCPNVEDRDSFHQAIQNGPSYHEAIALPLLLLPVGTSLASLTHTSLQELGAIHLFGNAFLLMLILVAPLSQTRKLALTDLHRR